MRISIGKYVVEFSAEVLEILRAHRQLKQNDNEAGGIILGRLIGNTISVCRLSVPTELDKRSKTSFVRSRISGQIIIDYEFFNSDRQIVYLGEWHTHPESVPVPSSRDIAMINDQLKRQVLNTDFVILVIRGFSALFTGILDKNGLVTVTLKDN